MKPLFIKKNGTVSKVSGIIMNLIPSYTLAEYNALTHKPLLWVRTDEDYAQIPSEDVSYGSGSVKDALDELSKVYPTNGTGVAITTTDTSNPFVLPTRSLVRLVIPANQTGGLGLVMSDKTDFINALWSDQNHTNQLILSVILDKGSQIIKHPLSSSDTMVRYTTLE